MRFAPFARVILAALLAAPAFASPAPELAAHFARGEYMAAAEGGEAAARADDYAFAARSLLALCMTGDGNPDAAVVARAQRDAEEALKIDPEHEEGRLQLAIALSLKSRSMDVLDVWSAGYGDRGKQLAQEVLARDPGNFYAHGFLAVWNVEVRRRGGSVGAAFMGASVAAGRKEYAEASRLAPDDIGVHWQYARALAALDIRRYGREVGEVLGRALTAHADDHVEQVMQARAEKLSEAMKGSDWKAAQLLARTLL